MAATTITDLAIGKPITQSLTLQPSGDNMPIIGFGTWQLPDGEVADMVYKAIVAGYRCLDCASAYGNEVEVGQGIKRAIDDGVVTRKELFITSKLWNTYHRKEHVPLALDRTLSDLGLDYIDLYLIHFPVSQKFVPFEVQYPCLWPSTRGDDELEPYPLHETWAAMEGLVYSGKTRNIGVSNFSYILLMDLLSYAKIKPAVLQTEFHPQNCDQPVIRYAQKRGVQVTGYSIFGAASYRQFNPKANAEPSLLKNEVLMKIATKNKRTIGQVLLRWSIQQSVAVIPKSGQMDRMLSNRDIFNFELDEEDMKAISNMNSTSRWSDPGDITGIPIFD